MLPYIIYSFGIYLCDFLIIMVISRIPRTITVQVIGIFKCDTTPDTKQIISSKIFCDDFEHFIWRYFHFFLSFCINNFYRVFDVKMVFFKWYRLDSPGLDSQKQELFWQPANLISYETYQSKIVTFGRLLLTALTNLVHVRAIKLIFFNGDLIQKLWFYEIILV